jgi:hypothetical protein
MTKFKFNNDYSASYITGAKFTGIYDQYIALVDDNLEHLSAWIDDVYTDFKNHYKYLKDDDIYQAALNDVFDSVSSVYDSAKNIYIFKGIAPKGAFDVFTDYKLIKII